MKNKAQQSSPDDADRRLDEILSRIKYTVIQPTPSEGEIMEVVVQAIHELRTEKRREQ
jgi:hypothetical protein